MRKKIGNSSTKKKRLVKQLITAEDNLQEAQERVNKIREDLKQAMKIGEVISTTHLGEEKRFGKVKKISYVLDPKKMKKLLSRSELSKAMSIKTTVVRKLKGDDFIKEHGKRTKTIFVRWLSREEEF